MKREEGEEMEGFERSVLYPADDCDFRAGAE